MYSEQCTYRSTHCYLPTLLVFVVRSGLFFVTKYVALKYLWSGCFLLHTSITISDLNIEENECF